MATEIEKKYKLPAERRTGVEAELREQGAEFAGKEFEENTVYLVAPPLGKGGIVRLRRVGDRAILTFKRRVENRFDVKEQIEHETGVSDPEAVTSILNELGLRPSIVYEKRRSTWRFRSVEAVIDELPFGLFMEIEGSVTAIREAEILLGIEDLEAIHETYPMLTRQFGTDVDGVMESRFPK